MSSPIPSPDHPSMYRSANSSPGEGTTAAPTGVAMTYRPSLRQFGAGLFPRAIVPGVVLVYFALRMGPSAIVAIPLMVIAVGLGAAWFVTRSSVTLDARGFTSTRFGRTTTLPLGPEGRYALAMMKALQPVGKLIVRGTDGRRLTLTTTWWRPADLVELAQALDATILPVDEPLTPAQLERLAPGLQSWPQRHPAPMALIVVAAIVAVLVPIAMWLNPPV